MSADADLDRLTCIADDEADRRIAEWAGRGPEAGVSRVSGLLDELLAWKPGQNAPPVALKELGEACARLPAWAGERGRERLARAQALFEQREVPAFVVLGLASLPACYRHPAIAELLASSGRLAAQVFRRLRETADFLSGVMERDAFAAEGVGFHWCHKVRLVHAAMRYLARENPPPPEAPPGHELQDFLLRLPYRSGVTEPVNQCELAFVLQTFGYLTVTGLRKLRIRLERDEAEDLLFLWSVVGHLLGIRDELLPLPPTGAAKDSLEVQAERVYQRIDAWNRLRGGVSDSGRLLTATLVVSMREAMLRAMPRFAPDGEETVDGLRVAWLPQRAARELDRLVQRVLSSAPRSFVRMLIGKRAAEELGVGRAPLLHYVGHQIVFMMVARFAVPSEQLQSVPTSWARTPAQAWRRGAVLAFGRHMERWQRLDPPRFA